MIRPCLPHQTSVSITMVRPCLPHQTSVSPWSDLACLIRHQCLHGQTLPASSDISVSMVRPCLPHQTSVSPWSDLACLIRHQCLHGQTLPASSDISVSMVRPCLPHQTSVSPCSDLAYLTGLAMSHWLDPASFINHPSVLPPPAKDVAESQSGAIRALLGWKSSICKQNLKLGESSEGNEGEAIVVWGHRLPRERARSSGCWDLFFFGGGGGGGAVPIRSFYQAFLDQKLPWSAYLKPQSINHNHSQSAMWSCIATSSYTIAIFIPINGFLTLTLNTYLTNKTLSSWMTESWLCPLSTPVALLFYTKFITTLFYHVFLLTEKCISVKAPQETNQVFLCIQHLMKDYCP